MDNPALRGVERVIAFVAAALKLSLIAATAIMVGCIALQVVMRYVFGRTPSWSEELAVLMFSWTVHGRAGARRARGFPCPARHPDQPRCRQAAGPGRSARSRR